jgi:hypothetical protein
VDRGEPGVAGLDAVVALVLEVVKEVGDQGCGEVEVGWSFACLLLGVGEQQAHRVSVGGNRVWARVALGEQPVGEERLECWRERAHAWLPSWRSRRCAASASSSGAAWKYQ